MSLSLIESSILASNNIGSQAHSIDSPQSYDFHAVSFGNPNEMRRRRSRAILTVRARKQTKNTTLPVPTEVVDGEEKVARNVEESK